MAETGINREGRHFDVAIRYFEETLLDLGARIWNSRLQSRCGQNSL